MITFKEHHEPGYAARTIVNARKADLTIAFALDFTSAGERLTHKAAYGKYVGINFSYLYPEEMIPDDRGYPFAVREVLWRLKDKKVKSINFAGNGIYTLYDRDRDLTQERVDELALNFLKQVVKAYPGIKEIRSGVQTGIDEAFLKAADALGIPALGLAPKGWLFRDIHGRDIADEVKFLKRFGDQYDISNIL